MEPPKWRVSIATLTGTFTNSGNMQPSQTMPQVQEEDSAAQDCRFKKKSLPKNGITLPVDSHVYCFDPIFQYKLSIVWLLGIFLKSARVISCTNDIMTFDSGRWVFQKQHKKSTLKQQWIPVWIRMNSQIGWFSTTNAFLVPKCYAQLQRFGMMAMAWYGIRCKTQGHRFRMIWQGIINVLFCYYVNSICLLCLNKIEGCLNVHCFEREHTPCLTSRIFPDPFPWLPRFPDLRCLCCSLLAARDVSGVGRVCPSRNRTAFGRCQMSCFSHCWASWTRHFTGFTASPCCAAIKTFDTDPLFNVLALLHIIYIYIIIYIYNHIYIWYFPGGQSSHFMMIIAQNWMMDDGNVSKKHIYLMINICIHIHTYITLH